MGLFFNREIDMEIKNGRKQIDLCSVTDWENGWLDSESNKSLRKLLGCRPTGMNMVAMDVVNGFIAQTHSQSTSRVVTEILI